VVSSGTSRSNYKELLMRLTERDSLERMHVVADMISMFMYKVVLVLTFVERNPLSLRASRASPVDPD
jgi:hypothetical protein